MTIKLNIGSGSLPRKDWLNIDRYKGSNEIIVANVENLPYNDSSIDYILASHILEHLVDFTQGWREIHRVLKVGGILQIEVPYGFNSDPNHIHFFDENSLFWMILPFEHRNLDRDTWWKVIENKVIWEFNKYAWYLFRHLPKWYGGQLFRVLKNLAILESRPMLIDIFIRPLQDKKFIRYRLQKVS